MTQEEFINQWRKPMGCESTQKPEAPRICWCPICCNLEEIWKQLRKETIGDIIKLLGRVDYIL